MRSTHAMTAIGPQRAVVPERASTTEVTEFGALVQRWCTHNELSQSNLADTAGIHRSYLSRLVNGQRHPTDTVITALEKVMHTGGELAEAAARSETPDPPVQMRRRPIPAQLPAVCSTLHGREPELRALAACGPAPGLRLLIDGPPGVGKTALAVRHAHRITSCYRTGVLFADLHGHDHRTGPADPAHVLADFLNTLGLPVPDSFDDRVRAWRSVTWTSRLLIVLDDARSAEQVHPLLPGGPGCAVLVTSRYRLSSLLAGTGTQSLTLSPLHRSHSLAVLHTYLGARIEAEADIADRVAALCADLPQALSLAAERLSVHPEVPLAELVAEAEDLWALTEIADEPGCSMYATFRTFYEMLPSDHQRAWRELGNAAGRMNSVQLAEVTGWSSCHTRRVLDGLVLAHLVTRGRDGTHTMNDLAAAWGAKMHARSRR